MLRADVSLMRKILIWLLQDFLNGKSSIDKKLKPHPYPGKRPPLVSPYQYMGKASPDSTPTRSTVEIAYERFKQPGRRTSAPEKKPFTLDS